MTLTSRKSLPPCAPLRQAPRFVQNNYFDYLAGQAEDLLGDDVPLHLGGSGVDGARARVERDLPPGVARRRVAARVVGAGRPAGAPALRDQAGQPLDVEGELGDFPVVLAPVQLAD